MKNEQQLEEYVNSKQGGNCWGFKEGFSACWKTDIDGANAERGGFSSYCFGG
jgi:hypothetical protein